MKTINDEKIMELARDILERKKKTDIKERIQEVIRGAPKMNTAMKGLLNYELLLLGGEDEDYQTSTKVYKKIYQILQKMYAENKDYAIRVLSGKLPLTFRIADKVYQEIYCTEHIVKKYQGIVNVNLNYEAINGSEMIEREIKSLNETVKMWTVKAERCLDLLNNNIPKMEDYTVIENLTKHISVLKELKRKISLVNKGE